MTPAKHAIRLLALGAVLLAAGCGSEEGPGIPADSAAALQGQLDSIEGRFNSPNGVACGDIAGGDDPNTAVVQENIDALPDDVDPDVRDALVQSFERLFQLVEEQCEVTEPETDPDPVPVPETDPVPEPPPPETETDTTETTPPPTDPPTTTPETPTDPGQGGDGQLPDGGEGGQGGEGGEGGEGGQGGEGADGGASGGAGGGVAAPEDTG